MFRVRSWSLSRSMAFIIACDTLCAVEGETNTSIRDAMSRYRGDLKPQEGITNQEAWYFLLPHEEQELMRGKQVSHVAYLFQKANNNILIDLFYHGTIGRPLFAATRIGTRFEEMVVNGQNRAETIIVGGIPLAWISYSDGEKEFKLYWKPSIRQSNPKRFINTAEMQRWLNSDNARYETIKN